MHVVDSTTPASVPTGSVAVKDGTTTLGSGTLGATGSADITIPASTLSVGAHSLTAEYAGRRRPSPPLWIRSLRD